MNQTVPELTKQQIIMIKSAAMEQRRWVRTRYLRIRELAREMTDGVVRKKSTFKHPGGFAGAAELALAQVRVKWPADQCFISNVESTEGGCSSQGENRTVRVVQAQHQQQQPPQLHRQYLLSTAHAHVELCCCTLAACHKLCH